MTGGGGTGGGGTGEGRVVTGKAMTDQVMTGQVMTGQVMTGLLNATVTLGGRDVLHDVSFVPRPGELAALCGPNGAGKTTLLRALAGLLPGMAKPDPRRVAYLPQGASCAWALTVEQVAALGRIPHRDTAKAPVTLALRSCGILPLRQARIDRISGGEARRAMLARAFATEPEVFLLDEPTSDLDPAAAHAIMRLLRDTARAGRAVVVVLHSIDLALRYAHRMVVLQDGRVSADLPADQALPAAAAAFGLGFGVDPTPRLLPPA
jgi:iron complex transport system ATP-binding protein